MACSPSLLDCQTPERVPIELPVTVAASCLLADVPRELRSLADTVDVKWGEFRKDLSPLYKCGATAVYESERRSRRRHPEMLQ